MMSAEREQFVFVGELRFMDFTKDRGGLAISRKEAMSLHLYYQNKER